MMAHFVGAVRTHDTRTPRPCPRCGIRRQVSGGRPATLCSSCRAVVSDEEREVWE
jgi:hypothetical protein